jgi:iron(III) transport system ATP-binding protein
VTTIRLEGVSKDFDHHRVLHDVSLQVEAGEFVVLLGASGSGKSTTLRLISGLERVSAGTISFGDRVLSSVRTNVPANKRSLGFVFQSYALWPHLSVRQNVEYPLRARRRRSSAQIGDEALRILALLHLDHLADRRISQLSGGQQQRVGLARAVVGEPSLVLFDEPLSNLDTQLRSELRTEIKRLQRSLGFTAIYVTHDHNEAITLADRIAVFEHGRISQVDTARKAFSQPATESIARFLGFENLVKGFVSERLRDGRYRVAAAEMRLEVTVSGSDVLKPGDPVLLGNRRGDVTIRPIGGPSRATHGPAEQTADISDLEYSDTGYTATLTGTRLVGVLPPADWGPDPEARLRSDGWRARATIDWTQAHAVPRDLAPNPMPRAAGDNHSGRPEGDLVHATAGAKPQTSSKETPHDLPATSRSSDPR